MGMLGDNYKLFKLSTGEMIITKVADTDDEGTYELDYPAVIVPIPPEQAGGKPNQIGFTKYMPFSQNDNIMLNPKMILIDSNPIKNMLDGYLQWVTSVKAQEGGIIVPSMQRPNNIGGKNQADFSRLNT